MAVQRIDQIQTRAVAAEQQEAQFRRLSLFTKESFDRVTSVQLGGARVDIPHMSAADQATAAQLFASVAAERQPAVQAAFDNLANLIFAEGGKNPNGVEVGSFSSPLVNALGDSLEVYMTSTGVEEADQAVQGVLFGAMVGIEQELGDFAQNLQDKLNLSSELRTDITELRDELADWTDPEELREFSWHELEFDDEGRLIGVTEHTESLNKAQAEAKLESLDDQRATLGDFTEIMKFDLQRMSQDYQQAMQTLSALLKSQHDSLMAIVRNCKAS